jgi:hypothetical protein
LEQRAGEEQVNARGSQLQSQRQTVETLADLRHMVPIRLGQGEIRPDQPGALQEELHGGVVRSP